MMKTIGLVLLILLKMLGWILLALLLFAAAVLLLVCFVPVRYRMTVHNGEAYAPDVPFGGTDKEGLLQNFRAHIRVTWLLHFIHVSFVYDSNKEGIENKIRAAGIDVRNVLAWFQELKTAKLKRKAEKERRRTFKVRKKAKPSAPDAVQETMADDSTSLHPITEDSALDDTVSGNSASADRKSEDSASADRKSEDSAQAGRVSENSASADRVSENSAQAGRVSENSASADRVLETHRDNAKTGNEIENEIEAKDDVFNSKKEDAQKKAGRTKFSKGATQKKAGRTKSGKEDAQKKADRTKSGKENTNTEGRKGPGLHAKFASIKDKITKFHTEFTDETNRSSAAHLWKEICFLLRSFKPRKLKADITFSLADPAVTGRVLGILSLLPLIYRYPCKIMPDFTSEKLYVEGELMAEGRVTVFLFLVSLLRLIRDKNIKASIRKLQGN